MPPTGRPLDIPLFGMSFRLTKLYWNFYIRAQSLYKPKRNDYIEEPGVRMQYVEFQRIERIKGILDTIAYASLALDVGIAIVTLISLRVNSAQLSSLEYFLNLSLSAEVIVVLVLMGAMLFLYRYQRIILDLARMSRSLTGKTGQGHEEEAAHAESLTGRARFGRREAFSRRPPDSAPAPITPLVIFKYPYSQT